MGSTISPGNRTISLKAFDNGGDDFDHFTIYKNGDVMESENIYPYEDILDYQYNVTVSSGDYYYVRVKQYYTGEEAISSPIWIE